MLLRFFFFLLLFYLLYRIYFSGRGKRSSARRDDHARGEEMVLDPQCKSYVPKSAAMLRGDQYFCSEHCAALYLAARS
jgi:hypothetical protein